MSSRAEAFRAYWQVSQDLAVRYFMSSTLKRWRGSKRDGHPTHNDIVRSNMEQDIGLDLLERASITSAEYASLVGTSANDDAF